MPLYEYRCKKCDRVFEVMQKFSDAPVTSHQDCGGEVEKLISTPSFQFKGSGWYITDYGRSGKGGEKTNGKTDGAGGESKPSTGDSPATAPAKTESSTTPKSE